MNGIQLPRFNVNMLIKLLYVIGSFTPSCMNAEEYSRKRLFGKRVKNKQVAELVGKYLTEGLTISDIMTKTGFKDRKTIYAFRDHAVELGLVEITEQGQIVKVQVNRGDYMPQELKAFSDTDLVDSWIQNMKNRKSGKPIRSWRSLLSSFYRTCQALKMTPEQFIAGLNQKEILDHARQAMQNYKEIYEAGGVQGSRNNADISHVMYSASKAVRDFMAFHGYPFPRGEKGVMSQSITTFRGKYADVKLSNEQIQQMKLAIFERNTSYDSDLFRCFMFGLDTCSRKNAIINAKLDYEIIEQNNHRILVVSVFESKTQEIKGGIWKKYILDPDLQEQIISRRTAGKSFLLENRGPADIEKLSKSLKSIYQQINPNNLEYILSHPFHSLRHFGAHYHLSRCNYNYAAVAKIGGWNTNEEVEKSYGEMPPEVLINTLFGEFSK